MRTSYKLLALLGLMAGVKANIFTVAGNFLLQTDAEESYDTQDLDANPSNEYCDEDLYASTGNYKYSCTQPSSSTNLYYTEPYHPARVYETSEGNYNDYFQGYVYNVYGQRVEYIYVPYYIDYIYYEYIPIEEYYITYYYIPVYTMYYVSATGNVYYINTYNYDYVNAHKKNHYIYNDYYLTYDYYYYQPIYYVNDYDYIYNINYYYTYVYKVPIVYTNTSWVTTDILNYYYEDYDYDIFGYYYFVYYQPEWFDYY